MTEERQFKGIWIPAQIWDNDQLTPTEKIVWAEVDSLCSETKPCYASNETLGKILGLTDRRIQQILSKLKQMGFIKQIGFDGRTRLLVSSLNQNFQVRPEARCTEDTKPVSPIENSIENNINIIPPNNIINNIICPPKEDEASPKPKRTYGEFHNVKLTLDEYDKLKAKYQDRLELAISMLDDYIESKGKKYKSHYAVMKETGWVWEKTMAVKQPVLDEPRGKRW